MWGFFGNGRIYLDHASATPVLPDAVRAVTEAMELFGNPGATHAEAARAKQTLQESREKIAHELACKSREIIFTSGLTEANNLAILGRARALTMDGTDISKTHWLVSAIEHDSVLESFSEIERLGGRVTHVDPDKKGIISPEILSRALRPDTVLVSLGWANNEIGVVQPIKALAVAIRDHEKKHKSVVLFHTDAGQAPLYLFPHVHTLGVDLFVVGSGKIYGPRGVAALYMSNRVADHNRIAPVMIGGKQERGLRAGTEDPALAAGFATAFAHISSIREEESRRLMELRDDFAKKVQEKIPDSIINTDLDRSLPHMLNISLPNINAEYLTLVLDRAGIAISTKSACNEGEKSSHVVHALGGESWRSENTLRFSLGIRTTSDDLEKALEVLVQGRAQSAEN
jgi:cysteine desulfurase